MINVISRPNFQLLKKSQFIVNYTKTKDRNIQIDLRNDEDESMGSDMMAKLRVKGIVKKVAMK